MVGMGTSWRQSNVVVLSGCEVSSFCALAKAWKSTHATADSQRWSSSNLDRASAAVLVVPLMCRMSLVGNKNRGGAPDGDCCNKSWGQLRH